MSASLPHATVLLHEAVEALQVKPDGIYVDATSGLGGHTGAIAQRLTSGLVFACDRDSESQAIARRNTESRAGRIKWVLSTFSQLRPALHSFGIERVSGLLADLGVSRLQLTEPERGFSLQADGPLDMRMDRRRREERQERRSNPTIHPAQRRAHRG